MNISNQQTIREEVDNYKDTIYAIVGFMNLFRYDNESKTMRDNILLFQGCKLYPKVDEGKLENERANNGEYVTPDIGIVLSEDLGIIGEVKCSFPKDNSLWRKAFTQLMNYDRELNGWPTTSGNVKTHDVVLLTHLTRATAVKKYFEENEEISFIRPFSIIEFHRYTQLKEFFFLRLNHGNMTESVIGKRLEDGIPIPMNVFINEYSRYKLYDAKPPLPYLLEIIWTNIIALRASENIKFSTLRSNQKIEVELELNELTDLLYRQFTFYQFSATLPALQNYYKYQPKFPKHSWVVEACKKLIESGDAIWKDETEQIVIFYFKRRTDIFDYFVKLCSKGEDKNQLKLFEDKNDD